MTPTYRGWSDYWREFVRGLNTEVTRSLTNVAMVLVELVEDQHDRYEHTAVTQVHDPIEEVKPLRPACLYRFASGGYKGVTRKKKRVVFVFLVRMLE